MEAKIKQELLALIEKRELYAIKNILKESHPSDLAELFDDIQPEDSALLFRILPRELAHETFEYLDIKIQKELLRSLGHEKVAEVLNDMSDDDRTTLFEELPAPVVQQLLELLTDKERQIANTLLGYSQDSVGRMMTTEYLRTREYWPVSKALDHIRRYAYKVDNVDVIFVVGADKKLKDAIKIKDLLMASPEQTVKSLMREDLICLNAHDDRAFAVDIFKQYDKTTLPVVDSHNHLLGVVTVDDVLDVVVEEDTEDIQKFGGLEALNYPYLTTVSFELIRKRAGWLVILFLSEMLTASAMTHFQYELEKAIVLNLFVPLIISSGGNSGSQAATLVIRALALNEIGIRDWWKVVQKEVISGVILGVILGTLGFVRISLWASLFPGIYGTHWLLVATTVGVALIGIVLWGTLSGSMLPIVLKRLGFDPATSSAPFVATLVDVTGLIIYFTIAAIILKGTLL
ncbi:magnesium transporter [Chitinophaga vietnamensis]|uniref:magnesium transporter n=1 Tax=Chitinophaga vietnamensis TaxID=2593957 RepID=UPI00117792A0|nr:magnesium transporter [Chitinophaga vietnamensis]